MQTRSPASSKPVEIVRNDAAGGERSGSDGATAAIVVGVAAALVIAAVASVVLRRKGAPRPGRAAFEDLAGLLRLSRLEQETVREMAAASGIVEPVTLLVSAEKMREAARAYLRIAAGTDVSLRTQRVLTKVHGS